MKKTQPPPREPPPDGVQTCRPVMAPWVTHEDTLFLQNLSEGPRMGGGAGGGIRGRGKSRGEGVGVTPQGTCRLSRGLEGQLLGCMLGRGVSNRITGGAAESHVNELCL